MCKKPIQKNKGERKRMGKYIHHPKLKFENDEVDDLF